LPQFKPVSQVKYQPKEPIIALELGGIAKAYPMSVLMWHEIANDTIDGVPVAVTFCPLRNSAIVYERIISMSALLMAAKLHLALRVFCAILIW